MRDPRANRCARTRRPISASLSSARPGWRRLFSVIDVSQHRLKQGWGKEFGLRTDRESLRTESVTHVSGINRNPCVRNGPGRSWLGRQDSNLGMAESKSNLFLSFCQLAFRNVAGVHPQSDQLVRACFGMCRASSDARAVDGQSALNVRPGVTAGSRKHTRRRTHLERV
jgi:hypothetical protein